LNVGSWNVNGWTGENSVLRESIINKLDLDVVCISETHLKNNEHIEFEGFTCFNNNRKLVHRRAPKGSGGIAILVRDSVLRDYSVTQVSKDFEGILGIQLENIDTGFISVIFCCYLSPENSTWGRNADNMFSQLTAEIYANQEADLIVVTGDFNARIGKEQDYVMNLDEVKDRIVLDEIKAGHANALLDFMKDTKMVMLNGRITPEFDNYTSVSTRGAAVVDYIMTGQTSLNCCKQMKVELTSDLIQRFHLESLLGEHCKAPDHSLLHAVFTLSSISANQNVGPLAHDDKVNLETRKKRYDYKTIPENFLTSPRWHDECVQLIDELLEMRVNQTNIDKYYDKLCKKLFIEIDECIEYKYINSEKSKRKLKLSKPYWDEELTEAWKLMVQAEKHYIKAKSNVSSNRRELRALFMDSQKSFDKLLRTKARRYHAKCVSDVEQSCDQNPRDFWDHIKKLGPHKSNNIPLKVKIDDDTVTNLRDVKDHWNSEFSRLLNPEQEGGNFDDEFLRAAISEKVAIETLMENHDHHINNEISPDEILVVVGKLKKSKACGIDGIANEVLKHQGLSEIMLHLFSNCFQQGLVPSTWLKGIIKPVPKGCEKDPLVPLNYRGITLISCVAKIYSSLLNNRLTQYCNDNDLLADEQNGFRAKRSCEDHIFSLTTVVQNRLNDGKPTYCAFIDLEKAFDWLNRDLILYKLLKLGVIGNLYHAIKSLLHNTMSQIALSGNVATDWFNITSGVRQGDPLSPTLFNIFINDLVDDMKLKGTLVNFGNANFNTLLYADDMVLIAENEDNLQKLLEILSNWCKKWRVKINAGKSKVIHFRKPNQLLTEKSFHIDDMPVLKVDAYKYLGILLDAHLKFDMCINALADSAGRALGATISKFKAMKNVGYGTYTKLFNCGVKPIMEYGSSIWGSKNGNKIDAIQHRAMRWYLGVHKFAPILGMQGDMGWFDSKIGRKLCMFRLWNRLIKMELDRLSKDIFAEDFHLSTNNWSFQMLNLFREVHLEELYWNQSCVNLSRVETILKEKASESWLEEIHRKPKLRTYITFKSTFTVENYVRFGYNKKNRSLMAQIRLGILPLRVETGRYSNIPLQNRLCENCIDLVEDETHFIIHCTLYRDQRQTLFEKAIEMCPNFPMLSDKDKMCFLFNDMYKELCSFIVVCWNIRTNMLYV